MVKRTSVRLLALLLSFATCGSLLAEERHVTRSTRPENARWGRSMSAMGHQVRERVGNSSYYRLVAGKALYADIKINGEPTRLFEAGVYVRNCSAFAGYGVVNVAGFAVYRREWQTRVVGNVNYALRNQELVPARPANFLVYGIPITVRAGAQLNLSLGGTVSPQDREVRMSLRLSGDARVYLRCLVGFEGVGIGIQGSLLLVQASLVSNFGARDQELFGRLQFSLAGGRLLIDIGVFLPPIPGAPSFYGFRMVDKTLVAAWWNLL